VSLLRRAVDLQTTRRVPVADRLQTLHLLATSLESQSEHDAALSIWKQALELARTTYGADAYRVAQVHYEMGRHYVQRRRFDDAEAAYRASVETYDRSNLDADHLWRAYPLLGLGQILFLRDGDPEAATEPLRRALDIYQANLTETDLRVTRTQGLLGACLKVQGRYAAARDLLEQSYAVLMTQRDLPRTAVTRQSVRVHLRELYDAVGATDAAQRLRRDAERGS
jgi:tetratricopeptide (TPR) repeat protein